MDYLGEYSKRKVYWWSYAKEKYNKLPDDNWICLAIADSAVEFEIFNEFVRSAVNKSILEFKSHGIFCEELHDWFDDIVNLMEVTENHPEIAVMTTWHNNQSLADTLWQCFHATCLPESANHDKLKIVCVGFGETDKRKEIESYLKKINEGWLPSDDN